MITRMNPALAARVALALALLATALIYLPGLAGGLLFDDLLNLAPVAALGADPTVSAVWEVVTGNRSGPTGRPLAMASFVADALAFGFDPGVLKRTNLALHLVNGLLVYVLAGLVFARQLDRGLACALAALAAALWLLSPVHVSTVLYAVQRMAMLSALFVLAGCVLYVTGRRALDAGRPRAGWAAMAAAVLGCWPLATFSKENGAVLPLLLLVLEGFVLWPQSPPAARRTVARAVLPALVLPLLAGAGFVVAEHARFLNYQFRDFTLGERLMSQPRALLDYLLGLLWPSEARLGFFHDDFRASRGWLEPPGTLLAAVLWGLALAWALTRRQGAAAPLAAAGLLLFLAGHAIEGTVFPLELYFEHRNYLPAAGAAVMVCAALAALASRAGALPALALGMALVLLSAGLTGARVGVWQDDERIVVTGRAHHPQSVRAASAMAGLRLEAGDAESALAELLDPLAAYERKPAGLLLQALYVACVGGATPGAKLLESLAGGASYVDVRYVATALEQLGAAYRRTGCPSMDTAQAAAAIADGVLADPVVARRHDAWGRSLRYYAADLALAAGLPGRAVALIERYRKSDTVFILLTLGEAYRAQGAPDALGPLVARLEALNRAEPFPGDLRRRLEALAAAP